MGRALPRRSPEATGLAAPPDGPPRHSAGEALVLSQLTAHPQGIQLNRP
jgi:hypothetical protein